MADFVRIFGITIPASPDNFVINDYPTPLGLCEVTQIQVIFPPGCAGQVGVSIAVGGQQFFPPDGDPQIRLDDAVWDIHTANLINSGQFDIQAFNGDVNDHTIQIVYYCDNLQYSPGTSMSTAVAV